MNQVSGVFSESWDKKFMLLAHHLAGWSKETGRRVGSVIVGSDLEVRSTGFNGFPRGVNDLALDRHDRETGAKYIWSSHAERNAIYNAARIGVATRGCTIYVPWYPCVECTKAIIQAGLSHLVAYRPDLDDKKWASDFIVSETMLSESGVSVRYLERLMDLPVGP